MLKDFSVFIRRKVQFTKDDSLYLLGDYIDRGPESKGVIDYILRLQNDGFKVHCIMGNHERMLLDALEYESKVNFFLMHGGKQTLNSYNATLEEMRNHPHMDFYKNLEFYIELEDYYLVHAGFDFRYWKAFTDTKAMLWIRNWHHRIDRRQLNGKIVVHGHTPQRVSRIESMKKEMPITQYMNIDAGCFCYKKMCALDLTNQALYFVDCIDEVDF